MGTWLVPIEYFVKKNDCECFEELNTCLYVHSIFQNAHEFFTLYKGICKYTMKQQIGLYEEATNLYML
jgi:hypothetical protein